VIRCEDAIRELWSYLSDEATDLDRHLIVEHLDACRRCCGELAFLRELRSVIASACERLPADVEVRMEAFLATLEGATQEEADGRSDAQG
jgi:predicted anti-sigma-YlaC factor YlaD